MCQWITACWVGVISPILQIKKRSHGDYGPTVINKCTEDLGHGHRCVWFRGGLKTVGLSAGGPSESPGELHSWMPCYTPRSSESLGEERSKQQIWMLLDDPLSLHYMAFYYYLKTKMGSVFWFCVRSLRTRVCFGLSSSEPGFPPHPRLLPPAQLSWIPKVASRIRTLPGEVTFPWSTHTSNYKQSFPALSSPRIPHHSSLASITLSPHVCPWPWLLLAPDCQLSEGRFACISFILYVSCHQHLNKQCPKWAALNTRGGGCAGFLCHRN